MEEGEAKERGRGDKDVMLGIVTIFLPIRYFSPLEDPSNRLSQSV